MSAKKGTEFYRWFANTIFFNEELTPKEKSINTKLPEPLRLARQLERNNKRLSSAKLFLKEGEFLADYTDDYKPKKEISFSYPTYKTLSDSQLRAYFTCRTQIRNGDFSWTPQPFIYLYCNELINNIGINSPREGYEQLVRIQTNCSSSFGFMNYYMDRWINDYIIYYNLDPSLISQDSDDELLKELLVIDNMANETSENILKAIFTLAPSWKSRSRFYKEHSEDMNAVIVNVIRKMSEHYNKKCKGSLSEQFGKYSYHNYHEIFMNAVFADPIKRKYYEYKVDDAQTYIYEDKEWFVHGYYVHDQNLKKLERIIKTIDKVMRDKYAYSNKIKAEISTKWQLKLIKEEIDNILNRKKEAKRKKINLASLEKIRNDADYTKEKLAIEDELIEEVLMDNEAEQSMESEISENNFNLTRTEQRFVHCLLYGESLDWLKEEGLITSVLVDAVNDKLYENFADSVLDDHPSVIPDYLKEMKELFPA